MKEIFTDLYKKLAGFFNTSEKENVKEVACNRLKLVLMQDRTNLTPQLLERMRGEMIDLLSKYVEMDKEALELNFAHEGESMALMLSIPVVRAKDEEEIQAILEAEEESKAVEETEEESEESEELTDEEVCDCGCQEDEECTCGDECDCDTTCSCGCKDEEAIEEEAEEVMEEVAESKIEEEITEPSEEPPTKKSKKK